MIGIIVPIYNEEAILSKNKPLFLSLSQNAELIFVDGGSVDKSRQIASSLGRVLSCAKGRSIQMNYGARSTGADILLFLHADTTIPLSALVSIERALHAKDFVGGCLTQRIEHQAKVYRFIESQGNMRARLSREFYGDQGIFARKDVFFAIGGFPEVPLMEDVLFSRALRKAGKTVVLPDAITVSARRWMKKGVIRTVLLYHLILLLFLLKVPLKRIQRLYGDIR